LIADYLLIIANSGRMLAQAAQLTGFKPLVIDLFADLDTRLYAVEYQQVSALSIACLAPAVDYFIQHYAVGSIVYGSGFELYPDSLYYLQARLQLLGNSPDTFKRVQNKAEFFAVLTQLNIPYPESVFTPPHNQQDWLIKPLQGQGGVGIQHAEKFKQFYFYPSQRPFRFLKPERSSLVSSVYWQKYQQGSAHSVLFLADAHIAQVVGFNTQWTVGNGFIFSGIFNHCSLAKHHQAEIINWLNKLVPVFKLTGLNSLDFIHQHGQNYALEINARPPASMQLYAADLLPSHLAANLFAPTQTDYTGYQIIYAPKDLRIPENHVWQNGYHDLPTAGQLCRTGQPICSIIAHQSSPDAVLDELHSLQHSLYRSLLS
jgi:methenyltetrahydromethanopterin cyclohydrolase